MKLGSEGGRVRFSSDEIGVAEVSVEDVGSAMAPL